MNQVMFVIQGVRQFPGSQWSFFHQHIFSCDANASFWMCWCLDKIKLSHLWTESLKGGKSMNIEAEER